LLVTGILRSQQAEVAQALKVVGFSARLLRSAGQWSLLEARP
jgi:hypothetical protein